MLKERGRQARNDKEIEHTELQIGKNLELACDRINIFIGEPNTGKSNILEAIGLLSFLFYGSFAPSLEKFVRFESMTNLFYDI